MAAHSRPSLDVLVPLVMIEDNVENEGNDDLSCEAQKEVLRHFESGDIVIVRLESHCLPAIVFNISGLVMKFDIDRQVYHVCLLDKEFTERWIDATDMIIYSVPMIAECQNEQTMSMWSTANELLEISNNNDEKMRLEEFKKRFNEARHQQVPLLSLNTSKKNRRSHTLLEKSTSQQILCSSLTTCEELHIIESIYQLSSCTYAEAKRMAEDTYTKIICINNRENNSLCSAGMIADQWFLTFATRQIDYLRKYASMWLPDLEGMTENIENGNDLHSLISLMKASG